MRAALLAGLTLLSLGAHFGDAQLKGDNSVPTVETEEKVGDGDWGDFGWKVGTSHANVIRIGKKWQLSGVGDSVKDDDWLRLFDVGNRGFYGGFAAGKIWGKSLIGTTVQIGNKWKLQELANDAEKGWLRLTSSSSNQYFGGLAVGKLKTRLVKTADAETDSLRVGKAFKLAPMKGAPEWLALSDPETKEAHKQGGLSLGGLKAETIRATGVTQTRTLKLGAKFALNGGKDGIKDDDYLRLMSHDNKRLFGGFAAAKLWGQHLFIESTATIKGAATFKDKTVFEGKVVFKQPTEMTSLVNSATQIGNVILSNRNPKMQKSDALHLYAADGKTYSSFATGTVKAKRANAGVIILGKKWRLSGVGDKFHNDDWLRLMDSSNKRYYGGLAVKKLWTPKSFTHVIQLGTKWRLSGVGDKIRDDDWLRLMDIQNTKLYGGIAAAKMQTMRMHVKGVTETQVLKLKKRYSLRATLGTLQLRNAAGTEFATLEAKSVKIRGGLEARHASLRRVQASQWVQAKTLKATQALHISGLKLETDPDPASAVAGVNYLQLKGGSGFKEMGNLHLGRLKASGMIATGESTFAQATVKQLASTTATFGSIAVKGKIEVQDGIWVRGQRITPMPTSLMEDVQALKSELAALKLELAEYRLGA